MSQQELFDIYDAAMNPIGIAPRDEVHANGYWHKTFHCWVVRIDPQTRKLLVRFQKRQWNKDTFPDCFDITAAGHLKAGESIQDAVREIEEELGLTADFAELVKLDEIREEAEGVAGGVAYIDREVSSVFAWLCPARLDEFRIQREEVAGLYEADARTMIEAFEGRQDGFDAAGFELDKDGSLLPVRRFVTPAEFVVRDPSYYARMFRAMSELFV